LWFRFAPQQTEKTPRFEGVEYPVARSDGAA
jgi:hypothetical protein